MAWQEGDIGFFDDLDDVEDLDQDGDEQVDFMEGYSDGQLLEEYERMTEEED